MVLNAKFRQLIRKFVIDECSEMLVLREELLCIKRDAVKQILKLRDNSLNQKELLLERFSAINYELSESIQNLILNGQILPALGLIRWQIVAWQRCFTLYHSPKLFYKWTRGKHLREIQCRRFISSYLRKGHGASRQDNEKLRLDDDRTDFHNLSAMFHFNQSWIKQMYNICTMSVIDEFVKHSVRRAVFMEMRNTMRVVGVLLTHLREISTGDYSCYNALTLRYNSLDDKLQEMRESFRRLEDQLGLNRLSRSGGLPS